MLRPPSSTLFPYTTLFRSLSPCLASLSPPTGQSRSREIMTLTREVLVIVPVPDDALGRIAAVDRCLHVVDARGWFDVEVRETWPPWTIQRYLGQRAGPTSSRQERDELLASGEIILGGFPFPLDLRARAPCLLCFHRLPPWT